MSPAALLTALLAALLTALLTALLNGPQAGEHSRSMVLTKPL